MFKLQQRQREQVFETIECLIASRFRAECVDNDLE